MNEKEIQKWVKKSTVTTSDGFTDKLMQHLESKPVLEETFVWPFRTIFCMVLIAMVFASYIFYRNFDSSFGLLNANIDISRTPLLIGITTLFLLALNNLLKLNETYKSFKNVI